MIRSIWGDLCQSFDVRVLSQTAHHQFLDWVSASQCCLIDDGQNCIDGCLQEIARFKPDLILRTTPSHGYGVDEAVSDIKLRLPDLLPPLLCLQDHYGVGQKLEAAEAIATVDQLAVALCKAQHNLDAHSVGWGAHQHFISERPWIESRNSARHKLMLQEGQKLVLYAGICSGLSDDSDYSDYEQFITAAKSLPENVVIGFRPHPRLSQLNRKRYMERLENLHPNVVDVSIITDECERLAMSDVLISSASAINLDALAYQAAWGSKADNCMMSLYLMSPAGIAAMKEATGGWIFPSHYAGHGSCIITPCAIASGILVILNDADIRTKLLDEAVAYFCPRNNVGSHVVEWLEARYDR